ncbi:MAG: tRNA pseudouridine(55) synthase TruB [Candidatus Promineifilaceae bacterium]|nr:tRNA pseudouridine(55) synthase TruB [Candidatus Promineifilaceae bacterium]
MTEVPTEDATIGVLSVDKPLELTSHDVVQKVRRLADIRRVGHAGTLDPLATGVLVLALGRATRLLEYVVALPKTYEARVRMGQISNTYDGEGEIVEERPVTVGGADIEAALEQFRGTIEQVPPMYSAIRKGGQRLYELARKGVEVQREAREVTVYNLTLERWEPPDATLRVVCSTGTYVRSLAHDLGQALGCGAYLAGLRRTAVGSFTAAGATPLDALTAETWRTHLQGADAAVQHLPRLDVSQDAAVRLAQGQWLPQGAEEPDADLVRAYDPAGRFVGVVAAENEQWRPRKILYRP